MTGPSGAGPVPAHGRPPLLPGVALVTIAAGRHEHLRGQQAGLAAPGRTALPEHVIVVSMGDDELAGVVAAGPLSGLGAGGPQVHVIDAPAPAGGSPARALWEAGELPLAAARNAGVAEAARLGASVVVLLDVDCIPGPDLLRRYAEALDEQAGAGAADGSRGPLVACGPVAYLPSRDEVPQAIGAGGSYDLGALADLAEPHPARPSPAAGEIVPAEDVRLFWSLSFATTVADWQRLGGFDEAYIGYGGEDTDFGQRITASGGQMVWVGGAEAYHQHHPTSSPPLQHLEAIVRNTNVFHERWGWFCMEGWLADFTRLGLARYDEATDRWQVTRSPT